MKQDDRLMPMLRNRQVGEIQALNALDRLRRRSVRAWAIIGWVSVVLLLLVNRLLGAHVGSVILMIGGIINIGPTLVALQGRHDADARMLMGSLAAVLPSMLVFLLKGHPWQMDAHMYFFVGMAALVMLADWRSIVLATMLTAIHHVAFEWLAPEWVFTGSGHIGRVIFHVAAVGLQCGALTFLTIQLQRVFASQEIAIRCSGELAEAAEEARRRTELAMEKARTAEAAATRERSGREEQTQRLASERRGEIMTLAREFERSVTTVVKTIGQATTRLEDAAVQLAAVTGDATGETQEVASGASRAAADITQVASSVRDLSKSIITIAVAAGQQAASTDVASDEAKRSVQTVSMLEEHAIAIEGFLDEIRKIAAKTRLLALNATIEAARAGDAGRGFAVVAGEVKSLSADTRHASDRIGALITGIRSGVAETGAKLRSVNSAIGQVATAATGIAQAAGEQRFTAQQVDAGADRAARTADEIERRIGSVAKAAEVASSLSLGVRDAATDLSSSARDLRSSTDMFVSFLQADEVCAV